MELALELTNATSKAHAYTQDNVSHANSSHTIYGQRFILFYNILWANTFINYTKNKLVEK